MTPSEQARADAIADAETLRLYWAYELHPRSRHSTRDTDYLCILPDIATDGLLVFSSQGRARAAFRAVPGLRGE